MRTRLPFDALVFDDRQPPGERICRVRYDGDGFEPTDYDDQQLAAWQVQAYVRQLNEQRGVSEQAEACMLVGGLHGWDSDEFTDSTATAGDAPLCGVEDDETAAADAFP